MRSASRLQGRRFYGPNGRHLAAAKIQATWRMTRNRELYIAYRKRKWAAGVIAIAWVMHVKLTMVRKTLKATRIDNLEKYRIKMKVG